MKKTLIVTSCILVVILLTTLIISCAPTTAPTTKAPATTAPATTAPAQTVTLKWTILESNTDNSIAEMHRRLIKQVEEQTQGRVKVEVFWGASLGVVTDFLKMVDQGSIAQGATLMGTYHQWEIPLYASAGLPFFSHGYKDAPRALWKMTNEWDAMQKTWSSYNLKLLGIIQPHDTYIEHVGPISSIADLKGQKLWVLGYWQQLAESLGIVNVPLTPPEVFDALQKKILTGIWGVVYHGPKMLKFADVAKDFYYLPFGGNNPMFLAVNNNAWNKVSPQDRKTVEKIVYDLCFDTFVTLMDAEVKTLADYYKSVNCNFHDLSANDLATIEQKGKEIIWPKWLADSKSRNVPGQEWMDRYQAALKAVSGSK